MTMELPIIATRVMEKPNYKKHAAGLLERCREFYTNPENEKAFLKEKAGNSTQAEKAVSA